MKTDEDMIKEERAAGYVRTEYLAQQFGLSVRMIQNYRADGAFVLENTKWGRRYNYSLSCLSFIKYLLTNQSTADEKQRILAADAKYKESRAEIQKLNLLKRKGELHEARHVRQIMVRNIIDMRTVMRAIPGRIAQDLALCAGPNEIASTLKKAIDAALTSFADYTYDPEEFRALVEEEGGDSDAALDDDETTEEKPARKGKSKETDHEGESEG